MRIAVIGTGHIGSTLGKAWLRAGHDVVYGSRTDTGEGPGGAPVGPVADALEGADVVLLAGPGGAVEAVVKDNAAALDGKVVIDVANRMGGGSHNSREVIAEHARGAHYARAFNTLGVENYAKPPEGADLFYAADAAGRKALEELITAVGLRPALLGGADAADVVDNALTLWFALTKQQHTRHLALRVVTG